MRKSSDTHQDLVLQPPDPDVFEFGELVGVSRAPQIKKQHDPSTVAQVRGKSLFQIPTFDIMYQKQVSLIFRKPTFPTNKNL